MPRPLLFCIAVSVALCSFPTRTARAQGLIWNLPDDASEVTYEGTWTQEEIRPEAPEGNLEVTWLRRLHIKSVGQTTENHNGEDVSCRWIEFKAITGKKSEAGIDPGPVGMVLYKVLVPESEIIGRPIDDDGIPVSMLPIVRGYRRFGDEGETHEITAKALRVSPTISLLNYYPTLETVAGASDPDVQLVGAGQAANHRGRFEMEREDSRSVNAADFWVSKDVPFGLVKWEVTCIRSVKVSTDPRSKFREVTKVDVEMELVNVGNNAKSELQDQ